MIVIAEITVPADAFVLGRVLQGFPDATVELERVVPLQESTTPLFWVSGSDRMVVETALRAHPLIDAVNELTRTEDRTLFEVRWATADDELVQALIDTHATILEASGTATAWDFRLRFAAHENLSAFNMAVTAAGIPVTLRRLYNLTPTSEDAPLSREQRETLLSAYRQGYFEVPRHITLEALAEQEGLSDSGLSQRIRRGIGRLIEHTLLSDDRREADD